MDVSTILKQCTQHPPHNEATTCEWVILPILHEIGYAKWEVLPRDADASGNIPDYTLLPGLEDKTFYLEAKAWEKNLEVRHANQAVSYADENGKRWAVLTNGQCWRLYDNWIKEAPPSGRLVAEALMQEPESLSRFLDAISKQSVLVGGLAKFAEDEKKRRQDSERRKCLRDVIGAELVDEKSGLIATIRDYFAVKDSTGYLLQMSYHISGHRHLHPPSR